MDLMVKIKKSFRSEEVDSKHTNEGVGVGVVAENGLVHSDRTTPTLDLVTAVLRPAISDSNS